MGQLSTIVARSSIALLTVMGSACFGQTTPTNQFITAKTFEFSVFQSPIYFPKSAFAVGDVNGDGDLDVVANTGFADSPLLEVLLGDGKGDFTPHAVEQSNSNYPDTILLADVNGDGKLDLVTTTGGVTDPMSGNILSYGVVYVWLGNGNGTFQTPNNILPANTFYQGGQPAVGDVNGDGKPDIVLRVQTGIQVYWNEGSGKFKAGTVYAGGNPYPSVLAGADLNGDGRMDVVVAASGQNNQGIQIFLSNASGGLTPSEVYSIGTPSVYFEEIGVDDINQDGHPDLAIPTATDIAILLNQGDGTFRLGKPVNFEDKTNDVYSLPPGASCGVVIADFMKDGKPDLVSCGSVYPGNGDGTFADPRVYSVDTERLLAVGDFNNDHMPDLLAFGVNFTTNIPQLTLQFGQRDGSFSGSVVTQTPNAESIATADFNRDGIADVAVLNGAPPRGNGTARVTVFPGTGENYFAHGVVYPIGIQGGQIVAGDLNGDGITDLVIVADYANVNAYDTSVLLGKADGTFQPARNYVLVKTPAYDSSHIADTILADVNGDGKLDLVGDWGVALGKGDGSFKNPIALPAVVTTPAAMAVGDFNHDGHVDLAVLQQDPNPQDTLDLLILSGDGSGMFKLANEYDNVGGAIAIKAVDINKDSNLDLVILNEVVTTTYATNVISVALGSGDGSFGPLIDSSEFTGSNILMADFDRDGKLDLATDNTSTISSIDSITYGRGLGNGSFTAAYSYYISALPDSYLGANDPFFYHPIQSVVLDINGDGYPDIVALDDSGLVRIINSGNKTVESHVIADLGDSLR